MWGREKDRKVFGSRQGAGGQTAAFAEVSASVCCLSLGMEPQKYPSQTRGPDAAPEPSRRVF